MPNKSTSPMEPSDDIATNCHPRAGGDPVRRGRSIQSLASLEYPPARVTTIAYDFAISRRVAPEVCVSLALLEIEGAGKPGACGTRRSRVPADLVRTKADYFSFARLTRFLKIRSDLSIIGWRRSSVSRDEAQRTRATRRFTRVVRVIDAVRDRHLGEIERAYPVQARHVHGI